MPRGGARRGAGRPKGQGKWQEPTVPIRVPLSMIAAVEEFMQHLFYAGMHKTVAPYSIKDYVFNHEPKRTSCSQHSTCNSSGDAVQLGDRCPLPSDSGKVE